MTFLEELLRECEQLRVSGKSADEIAAYADKRIAQWNRNTILELRAARIAREAMQQPENVKEAFRWLD